MPGETVLPHARLWGSARGVVRSLTPQGRVLSALVALTTCVIADPASWPGLAFVATTVAIIWIATLPPPKPMARILLLGAVMLLPFFLLAPWSEGTVPRHVLPGVDAVVVPWRIVLTGLAVLAVTSCAASSLTRSDLREALARLPLPGLLAGITLQIVMQSDLLAQEAGRIMLALRGRGATHGWRNRVGVVLGLTRVWLPRLAFKAERVGVAMEARDFPTAPVALESHRLGRRDVLALGSAVVWTILVLLVRVGDVP